jgi:23S rRNA (guanosine2251-2'-O)-methyltransferase
MAKSGGKPSGAGVWLYGRHAVAAALANPERRWRRLVVLAGHEHEATALVAGARAARRGSGAAISALDRGGFAVILPRHAVHQGLALEVEPLPEPGLEDVLQTAPGSAPQASGPQALGPPASGPPGSGPPGSGPWIIVVLDQLSDPQNIGAVLRSAAAFGAVAVVIPARGAPPEAGALAKAASGALERVPLVRAVNLARALDRLKEAGFWICGLDEAAPLSLAETDIGERVAIVLGSEGGGIRRLVRERCDFRARLPTRPAQPTLNVSNAAAVALYELTRGRGG